MSIYSILMIVVIVVVGIIYSRSAQKKKLMLEKNNATKIPSDSNPFMDMRNMAFTADADQLGLENIADDKVYGLITEISMNPGIASVISFLTGDTSLYLSSGGGFIGAGQHTEVREMVIEKVEGFQKYSMSAEKINEPILPEAGMVNFNFLTKKGIYFLTENKTDLENGTSSLSNLFMEVNEIITEIRLKSN